MEDKLFRIGWMTKTLGLSRRILINYETVGLLTPAYKDEQTGYRYYSADNIVHIRLIRILQELGLSLEDIKDYFNDSSHIAEEIEKLVVLRNMLDQYIAQLRLRQTKNNEFEIKKVTLPEFCAYCVEFSGLDLARKTVRLRETYIEAFSKYTMDFDNKMCIDVPVSEENSGTFIVPVRPGSNGKNIRMLHQLTGICIYYRGPYENFPEIHRSLLDYAEKNNLTPYGFFRHIYMEGPPTHGEDKNSYITQIVLPINFDIGGDKSTAQAVQ